MWFILIPSLLFGVLGVLAPLRLDELGLTELGISGVFFVAAAIEVVFSPFLGRFSDRYGRLLPLRLALAGAIVMALLLPWPSERWLLAALVTAASIVFAIFFVPGTALLSDGADEIGIGQGFGFALLNLGWAPGNLVGSAAGGGLADALGDVGPYFILAGICALTLLALERGPLASLRGDVPPGSVAAQGSPGGGR